MGDARDEGLDPELDLWWIGVELNAEMTERMRRLTEPMRQKMAEDMRRAAEPLLADLKETIRRAAEEAGLQLPDDEEGQ